MPISLRVRAGHDWSIVPNGKALAHRNRWQRSSWGRAVQTYWRVAHDVTIFERGPKEPCRPEPAVMTSRRFGLYPSFAYGLGGTTNYWQGGLVELRADEMGSAWPEALKMELPRYYPRVVRQLYGERLLQHWRAQSRDPTCRRHAARIERSACSRPSGPPNPVSLIWVRYGPIIALSV